MASERTIKLAEQLLGKSLAEGAVNSEDGTIAELILMELMPQLNTAKSSPLKLLNCSEMQRFGVSR